MDKKVWLSRRAIKLHVVILIVVPAFLALCLWQVSRALGGNSLSWAYVFEWPLFAAYAVYMWWRFVHEAAEDAVAARHRRSRSRRPERRRGRGDRGARGRRRPEEERGGRRAGGLQRLPGPAGGAGQGQPVADAVLRGEGSNLQHPAPKADVLPIELPRTEAVAA